MWSERQVYDLIKADNIEKFQNYVPSVMPANHKFTRLFSCSIACLRNRPPLISVAAFFGAVKIFRYLIMQGVDLGDLDSLGTSVVTFAVAGGNMNILQLLDEHGVSFDGALFTAAEAGNYEVFMWLFSTRQIDLRQRKTDNTTILHAAARSGNWRLIDLLLKLDQDHLGLGDFYDILALLREANRSRSSSDESEEESEETWE